MRARTMRIDIGEAIVIAGPCSRGVVRLQERSLHEGGGRRGTGGRTHTVTRTGRSVIARGMSLSLAAQELAVAQKVAASGLSAPRDRGTRGSPGGAEARPHREGARPRRRASTPVSGVQSARLPVPRHDSRVTSETEIGIGSVWIIHN